MVRNELLRTGDNFEHQENRIEQLVRNGTRTVILDLESTLVGSEAFEIWAGMLKAGRELSLLTQQAMDGLVGFNQALAARLDIARPNREMSKAAGETYGMSITEHAVLFTRICKQLGLQVVIISGGFIQIAGKVAELFSVPFYANGLSFDRKTGRYLGFYDSEVLAQQGGKRDLVKGLLEKGVITPPITVIGDGVTDMGIEADLKIGFERWLKNPREEVRELADVCVDSLPPILPMVVGERGWKRMKNSPNGTLFQEGVFTVLSGEGVIFTNPMYGAILRERLSYFTDPKRDQDVVK